MDRMKGGREGNHSTGMGEEEEEEEEEKGHFSFQRLSELLLSLFSSLLFPFSVS